MQDDIADDGAINTILHELLHTCKDCFNHGVLWKKYAAKINDAYGYNIKRTSSAEEKGVKREYIKPVYNYMVRCEGCGQECKRQRLCKIITNPEVYRCGICHGIFKRIY